MDTLSRVGSASELLLDVDQRINAVNGDIERVKILVALRDELAALEASGTYVAPEIMRQSEFWHTEGHGAMHAVINDSASRSLIDSLHTDPDPELNPRQLSPLAHLAIRYMPADQTY